MIIITWLPGFPFPNYWGIHPTQPSWHCTFIYPSSIACVPQLVDSPLNPLVFQINGAFLFRTQQHKQIWHCGLIVVGNSFKKICLYMLLKRIPFRWKCFVKKHHLQISKHSVDEVISKYGLSLVMVASVWWEPAKSSEIQGTCGSWNAILSEKDKFAAVQENWANARDLCWECWSQHSYKQSSVKGIL